MSELETTPEIVIGTTYYPPKDGRAIGVYKLTDEGNNTYAEQMYLNSEDPVTVIGEPTIAHIMKNSDRKEAYLPITIKDDQGFVIKDSLLMTFSLHKN